jgi:hypothetical protein
MEHLVKLLRDSYDLQEEKSEKTAYWHLQHLRSEIKQLTLQGVSNRRETLEKFADDWNNSKIKEELIFERDINSHLKGETF